MTIPHKEAALAAADTATDAARAIGAANTLTFDGGRIEADNTDAPGLPGRARRATRAGGRVVLGAGGSARAVAWALRAAGRRGRGVEPHAAARGAPRARNWGCGAWRPSSPAGCSSTAPRSAWMPADDPFAALPLAPGALAEWALVADLVYGESETALIRAARAAGAHVVDGLEVLVRQGALSFERWTGAPAPLRRHARGRWHAGREIK